MTTDARALRTHEAVTPDWEAVKEWAKATFTKERIHEAALCSATVSLIGVFALSLHKVAASMCYVAARLIQGVQSYVAYAY